MALIQALNKLRWAKQSPCPHRAYILLKKTVTNY